MKQAASIYFEHITSLSVIFKLLGCAGPGDNYSYNDPTSALCSRPWRPGDFSEQRHETSLEGEGKEQAPLEAVSTAVPPSCAACPRGIWQDGNKGKGWGRTRCWGRPVATSCLCCRVLEALGASSSPGFPHPGCSPRIVGAASPGFPQVLQGQSHAVFPKPHRGVKVLQNLPNPPRFHLPSPAGRSWRLPRGPHATFWVQTIINTYIFSPLSPSAPGILIALVRWVSFCTLLKMLVKPVL